MDEQERMLTGHKPGDIIAFVEDAERAPSVGTRLAIYIAPRVSAASPLMTSHVSTPAGPWEVAEVVPLDDARRVKVYLVAL